MQTYYLDTCIWLDFYEKREANGAQAFELISKILLRNEVIIYSDLHVQELKNAGYSFGQITELFRIAKPNNLRHVHIHNKHFELIKDIIEFKRPNQVR